MFRNLTSLLAALGLPGILLLAALDSSIPVAGILDVSVIAMAAEKPDLAWICAALAVAGSTAGTLTLFWAARRGGRRFMEKAAPEGKAARFRTWFQRYGLVTVFVPAFLPIPMPMKLFVISAGVMGTSTGQFATVVVIGRILRYFGEAWLGVTLGRESASFLRTHALHFIAGAIALFLLLYGFIRLRDLRRHPAT